MSIQSVAVTADIAARRRASVMAGLVVLVVLLALVSLGIGPVRLSPLTVIDALFGGGSDVQQVIVREIRLPRTILAACDRCDSRAVRRGLAGAAAQSAGVAVVVRCAAVGGIRRGAGDRIWSCRCAILRAAGCGDRRGVRLGVRAARRSRPQRRTADSHPGGTGDIESRGSCDRAGDESVQQSVRGAEIAFWLLGSLEDRSFRHVMLALPFIVAGAIILLSQRNAFRALSLGEETAQSLGVDVGRLRLWVILGIALGVGGAVAVAGTIGFIGLVAPHLMRPLIGHDPARLLVPSALTGAALLLAADIAVRIIPSTSDIKVGVLTSIIGVPFFLYLIMRERRALGGGVA